MRGLCFGVWERLNEGSEGGWGGGYGSIDMQFCRLPWNTDATLRVWDFTSLGIWVKNTRVCTQRYCVLTVPRNLSSLHMKDLGPKHSTARLKPKLTLVHVRYSILILHSAHETTAGQMRPSEITHTAQVCNITETDLKPHSDYYYYYYYLLCAFEKSTLQSVYKKYTNRW